MALEVSSVLQTNGSSFSVSPVNSDVSVHIEEKVVKLAIAAFSTTPRLSLKLRSCLFIGTISASSSPAILDVSAERYDSGHPSKSDRNSLFPDSSIHLGPNDAVIPCFLNRRISKSELRQLSVKKLFPRSEDQIFAPSLRDIFASCVSLRFSDQDNSSNRNPSISRADLRVSLPTNACIFTPVVLPFHVFGGISVSDLLPPVISLHGRQKFRAGNSSKRMASSIGFLLDTDVKKMADNAEPSLLGLWVAGANGSPAEDLRIYATCLKYAFDKQLSTHRLLPLLSANHRSLPCLPFSSSQTSPYFLLAVVSASKKNGRPSIEFYECRISPALQPTFTILTATTLLPPASAVNFAQSQKLDFILGRAASVAMEESELFDSFEANDVNDEDDSLTLRSFERKRPPYPQPQPAPSNDFSSVPDVSVWAPIAPTDSNKTLECKKPFNRMEEASADSSSAVTAVTNFEDEWQAVRHKVEQMWNQNSSGQAKMSSTLISQKTEAADIVSPIAPKRNIYNTRQDNQIIDSAKANMLLPSKDACVGVGNSLMMLSNHNANRIGRPQGYGFQASVTSDSTISNVEVTTSNSCSCCSCEDSAELLQQQVEVVDTSGCWMTAGRKKYEVAERKRENSRSAVYCSKSNDQGTTKVNDKDGPADPCSLILKWLQRCGNETVSSSICEDSPGPENCSHHSKNDNVKTAVAICNYLNGDASVKLKSISSEESSEDEFENNFVSLSASSSSVILKPGAGNQKNSLGTRPVVLDTSYDTKKNSRLDKKWALTETSSSIVSKRDDENSGGFAARAREIVRQMDEWGLAATSKNRAHSTRTCVVNLTDSSQASENDKMRSSQISSRLNDVSCNYSISHENSYDEKAHLLPKKGRPAAVDNSIALPRIVALDSLRLGPTNTTLVMKNLAMKHLKDPSVQNVG